MTLMPILALLLATAAPVCPPQKLQGVRFHPGEALSYRIDVLGVDVGTFEVHALPPPPGERRASLELTSRAKTSAFVSTNAGRYDAFATALLAPDFTPLHYREDLDDGPVQRGGRRTPEPWGRDGHVHRRRGGAAGGDGDGGLPLAGRLPVR